MSIATEISRLQLLIEPQGIEMAYWDTAKEKLELLIEPQGIEITMWE